MESVLFVIVYGKRKLYMPIGFVSWIHLFVWTKPLHPGHFFFLLSIDVFHCHFVESEFFCKIEMQMLALIDGDLLARFYKLLSHSCREEEFWNLYVDV